MHRSRLIVLLGAAVALGSLPLPLVDLGAAGTVNGIDGDGWPGVAMLGVVSLIALLGDRAEGMAGPVAVGAIAGAGLAVVFSMVKLADASDAVDLVAGGSLGMGLWVLIGGSVVSLLGAVLSFSRRLG